MKRKLTMIAVACVAAVALLFTNTGCMTASTARYVANGLSIAGSDFATMRLMKDPASLKGLQDLAKALPDIPLGKVSAFQMGVLNRELAPIRAAANDIPKDRAAFTRIGNIISEASQQFGSGNPTVLTGSASAFCADFANGINHGIEFYQGQQSVLP